MAQNKSSAVMQQRHEAHDSLDDFPTPSWGTRAAIHHILQPTLELSQSELKKMSCWEPCCNRGYMARPLKEYFGDIFCTDIFDYGWSGMDQQWDFLFPDKAGMTRSYDSIFFNPPFKLAVDFILRSLELRPKVIGAFTRTSFLEGGGRYAKLYRDTPPTIVAHFAERVIIHKGIVRDPDVKYWDPDAVDKKTGQTGMWRKPSTATSYTWLFWIDGERPRPTMWIPPCRKRMEKPGDYIDRIELP